MNVVVLTKNPDSCTFDSYLRRSGYFPIVCPDMNLVVDFHRERGIGILLCDFRFFGFESNNPYESIAERTCGEKIPFVFYNDPFPDFTKECFIEKWERTLSEYYGSVNDSTHEFLECLSSAVICAAVQKDGAEVKSVQKNESRMDVLKKLKEMLRMPNSKFSLFELFFRNPGESIDGAELCRKMWSRDDSKTMANLYAYIAYIRKRLLEFPQLEMAIVKSQKGKYVFDVNQDALENFREKINGEKL